MLYAKTACETWLDVRCFGQVFAFKDGKSGKEDKGVSVGVRGPVSIHQAVSLSPVEIETLQITKSVNGEKNEKGGRSSDTMGSKHFVRFGVYLIKGSINVQLAEKTALARRMRKSSRNACVRCLSMMRLQPGLKAPWRS